MHPSLAARAQNLVGTLGLTVPLILTVSKYARKLHAVCLLLCPYVCQTQTYTLYSTDMEKHGGP